jgi:hypothetical protein
MTLHFANRRRIAPIGYHDEQHRKIPWLRDISFTPNDRLQLLHCVFRRFVLESEYSDDQIFLGDANFFGEECWGGIAECPIEWWDVIDNENKALYQIWLYNADSGVCIQAGTTDIVAEITQSIFFGEESLGRELAVAQQVIHQQAPETELARIIFMHTDD